MKRVMAGLFILFTLIRCLIYFIMIGILVCYIALGSIFTITVEQIIIGIVVGLIMTSIGYILLLKSVKWKNSMSFIVGQGLTRGNVLILLLTSIGAGLFEELIMRGFLLSTKNLFYTMNLKLFLIIIVFVNLFWAFDHLFNRSIEFKTNPVITLINSWQHLLIIFLSGILFTYLTLAYNSLTSPVIAHFALDFSFGLLYRKYC